MMLVQPQRQRPPFEATLFTTALCEINETTLATLRADIERARAVAGVADASLLPQVLQATPSGSHCSDMMA